MTDYKFSAFEAKALMINLLCSKLFLLCPADFTEASGSGALISVLLVYLIAFLFFGIYTKSDKEITLPVIKKGFGVIVSFLLLFSGAVTLNLLVYFSKITAYPNSPLAYLTVPFAVCMLLSSASGIKCIGKLHGFFVPVIYILLVFLTVSSYNAFDFTNLTPVLGKGIPYVLKSGLFLLSSLFEVVIFLFLKQHIKGSYKKTVFSSLLISLLLYLVTISAFLLIGGKTPDLPLLSVIQSGSFRRTDSVFLLLYSISGMLYLSSVLYFAVHIFADSFSICEKKALTVPFGLILTAFSGISFFNRNGQIFLSALSRWLWLIPFVLPLIFRFFKERR